MASAIVRLDPAVVNRIAAGEVIQRPSNALKEMIENSLDAGATSISVTAKGGGLLSLSISDNGHGIRKADFALVCERFATSKLAAFEDLLKISTYGFRGEALASISHVARVTITSMTEGAPCAHRATFADGRMTGEPRACAGVRGTTITAEDMFHNVPARRAALRNTSEEYGRILEVVERYAIQHAARGVAFSCRKQGDAAPDCAIPARMPALDAIGAVFGAAVKREVLPLEAAAGGGEGGGGGGEEGGGKEGAGKLRFRARGFVSGAGFSLKKPSAVFFINARLVDCTPLRRAMEAVYAELLPKGTHPFLYLDVVLPGPQVDVNVHPTKREVGFLYQEELVDVICGALRARLAGANTSRAFATQTLLPMPLLVPGGRSGDSGGGGGGGGAPAAAAVGAGGGSRKRAEEAGGEEEEGADDIAPPPPRILSNLLSSFAAGGGGGGGGPTEKVRAALGAEARKAPGVGAQRMVRVDHATVGSLDAYLVARPAAREAGDAGAGTAHAAHASGAHCGGDADDDVLFVGDDDGGGSGGASARAPPAPAASSTAEWSRGSKKARVCGGAFAPVALASLKRLLGEVLADAHGGLSVALREAALVGVVDRHLSLLQHGTRLLLLNHTQAARELFYQQALRLFANATPFALEPRPNAAELLCLGLHAHGLGAPEERAAAAAEAAALLLEKAPMLKEYFSIALEAGGGGGVGGELCAHKFSGGGGELCLVALPRLLDAHTPQLHFLPDFLLALAYDVEWGEEVACFRTVAQALAAFYAHPPATPVRVLRGAGGGGGGGGRCVAVGAEGAHDGVAAAEEHRAAVGSIHWYVAQVLFPGLKAGLVPPRKLASGHHVVQVASAERLYSVFERC